MTSGGLVRSLGWRRGSVLLAIAVLLVVGTAFWRRAAVDPALVATVTRGPLTAQLTTTGTLRPIQSITYRSPLGGREAEITELVPEGTRVSEGDLLARLDTTDLQRDVERARQDVRQAQLDVQVAEIERQEAEAAIKSVAQGEGALTVEEAKTRVQLSQKKVERLRQEYEQMKPLIDKGFITREELKKTADELEQSEEELALAKRRADVLVDLTHPRDRQRAELQLAQKESQLGNARAKAKEAGLHLEALVEQFENCSIYAKRPGMVVYEEYLSASPRRKIRVGDRVTGSQGLVTIPEVNRMVLDASVSEAEVHRVRSGQPATVRVEAFPDVRLPGKVTRVGTLARASIDRPFDEKRFDLVVELDATTADLRPEMTARADVVVGTRSNVLLVPVNALFDNEGTLVAHVVRPFGIDTRAVETGESNDLLVEVTAGLQEGDQVMLTDAGGSGTTVGSAAQPVAGGGASKMKGGASRENGLSPR